MAVIIFLLQSTALRPQTQSCLQGLCTCCSLQLEHSSRPTSLYGSSLLILNFYSDIRSNIIYSIAFLQFFPYSFFQLKYYSFTMLCYISVFNKVIHIYIYTFYQVLSHYRLLQDIEQSSLHHSSLLLNHFINSIVYLLIPNSYFISPPSPDTHFGKHKFVLFVCEQTYFCFVKYIFLFCKISSYVSLFFFFLDSTYTASLVAQW